MSQICVRICYYVSAKLTVNIFPISVLNYYKHRNVQIHLLYSRKFLYSFSKWDRSVSLTEELKFLLHFGSVLKGRVHETLRRDQLRALCNCTEKNCLFLFDPTVKFPICVKFIESSYINFVVNFPSLYLWNTAKVS